MAGKSQNPTTDYEMEHLVRGHRTPQQLALRARIILAAGEGANNTESARR